VPRPRRNVEEILATLREMERLTGNGTSVSTAAKKLGITDQTYYRWHMRYGSLSEDEAKRLSELDEERARLRRVIEEQAQDIAMLQDLTQGEIPSAARRRLAVAYLVDHYGISERRAGRVVGQDPSAQRYDPTGGDEDGPADGWDEADDDLEDELGWAGPGPGAGSEPEAELGVGAGERLGHDERGREPSQDPERPHLVEAAAERRRGPEPGGAPDLARVPVFRIPLLDDRIPVLLRVRTSFLHDLVWLARRSEMARLAGSGGVLDRLHHVATAPCRLVRFFGGHQEGRSD
jgi:putative transposase